MMLFKDVLIWMQVEERGKGVRLNCRQRKESGNRTKRTTRKLRSKRVQAGTGVDNRIGKSQSDERGQERMSESTKEEGRGYQKRKQVP